MAEDRRRPHLLEFEHIRGEARAHRLKNSPGRVVHPEDREVGYYQRGRAGP